MQEHEEIQIKNTSPVKNLKKSLSTLREFCLQLPFDLIEEEKDAFSQEKRDCGLELFCEIVSVILVVVARLILELLQSCGQH